MAAPRLWNFVSLLFSVEGSSDNIERAACMAALSVLEMWLGDRVFSGEVEDHNLGAAVDCGELQETFIGHRSSITSVENLSIECCFAGDNVDPCGAVLSDVPGDLASRPEVRDIDAGVLVDGDGAGRGLVRGKKLPTIALLLRIKLVLLVAWSSAS